ncbi:MAG: GGDEF domain-containing protein [Methylophilaceae bacterium]
MKFLHQLILPWCVTSIYGQNIKLSKYSSVNSQFGFILNKDNTARDYAKTLTMPQDKIHAILEGIISLTSERESNGLELALAQTLFKLAAPETMQLYHADKIETANRSNRLNDKIEQADKIPDGLLFALKECLMSGNTIFAKRDEKDIILFPLISSKNRTIGVIKVEAEKESYDHLLTIMILKIYNNFVSLMNENERDTLTGMLNRKTFDQKISGIISNSKNIHAKSNVSNQDSAYLAIFDIDHFKRVNDTYGHLIGDEVLLLFSQVMMSTFRDNDLLFRFGGEEFVGLFHCPSDEAMALVLNRFRKNIENYNFPQVGKVNVSCGFTKIDEFDLSTKLIDRADTALYHAKNNGRNQVCQHEELISKGLLVHNENTGEVELF